MGVNLLDDVKSWCLECITNHLQGYKLVRKCRTLLSFKFTNMWWSQLLNPNERYGKYTELKGTYHLLSLLGGDKGLRKSPGGMGLTGPSFFAWDMIQIIVSLWMCGEWESDGTTALDRRIWYRSLSFLKSPLPLHLQPKVSTPHSWATYVVIVIYVAWTCSV